MAPTHKIMASEPSMEPMPASSTRGIFSGGIPDKQAATMAATKKPRKGLVLNQPTNTMSRKIATKIAIIAMAKNVLSDFIMDKHEFYFFVLR
jgi:hypothetical protein